MMVGVQEAKSDYLIAFYHTVAVLNSLPDLISQSSALLPGTLVSQTWFPTRPQKRSHAAEVAHWRVQRDLAARMMDLEGVENGCLTFPFSFSLQPLEVDHRKELTLSKSLYHWLITWACYSLCLHCYNRTWRTRCVH